MKRVNTLLYCDAGVGAAMKIFRFATISISLLILGLLTFTQVSITYGATPRNQNDPLALSLKSPSVKAMLDTIAYAEATMNDQGYQTQFGFQYFDNLNDHPRRIICKEYKGDWLCSSAAGRYQILQKTWDRIAKKINARDFTPYEQDRAAVHLLAENNALELTAKKFLSQTDFKKVLSRINTIWASLPGSPYGQPTRSAKDLYMVYVEQFQKYMRNQIK